ncbi:MAG: methionyl-tRNA formyltransferase, partial [Candidatus Pacebacteria bacterium]|nr:methionyl-tRNA formyltransferase [Candidatus Paceibacterota bacterium]
GSSPIQWPILKGEKETGVTIMLVDEKMDHGPILKQTRLSFGEKETAKILHDKLAHLGADLLLKTIPDWINGKIKPVSQNEKEATFSEILKRESGRIDWKKKAEEIERQIRAFDPWPGSYTLWKKDGKKIKIKVLKSRVLISPENKRYEVGKVLVVPQNEIGVQCGDGNFLVVEKLQMEGKKETLAEDFLRGHSDFIGTVLD